MKSNEREIVKPLVLNDKPINAVAEGYKVAFTKLGKELAADDSISPVLVGVSFHYVVEGALMTVNGWAEGFNVDDYEQ